MTTAYPLRTEARARNRQALLDAAAAILAERGYGEASLSAIAARAGLTTGAVYSIFGSKAELVLALLEPGWGVPFPSELRGSYATFEDRLAAYGRLWRRRAAQPGHAAALELSLNIALATVRDDDIAARMSLLARENLTRLAQELDAATASFGLRLVRPSSDVAFVLTAALQGLSEQGMLLRELPSASQYAATAVDLVRTAPSCRPGPRRTE